MKFYNYIEHDGTNNSYSSTWWLKTSFNYAVGDKNYSSTENIDSNKASLDKHLNSDII